MNVDCTNIFYIFSVFREISRLDVNWWRFQPFSEIIIIQIVFKFTFRAEVRKKNIHIPTQRWTEPCVNERSLLKLNKTTGVLLQLSIWESFLHQNSDYSSQTNRLQPEKKIQTKQRSYYHISLSYIISSIKAIKNEYVNKWTILIWQQLIIRKTMTKWQHFFVL